MTDWIEWKGGECPVAADVKVEVKMRVEPGVVSWSKKPQELRWSHFGTRYGSGDIIAYRVVQS